MEAMVHEKTCIRCGLCPVLCPAVFSLTDGESARASTAPVPESQLAAAQEAADSCPVGAISLK